MDDPRASVHSLTRRAKDKTVFGQPVKAVPGYVARSMRPEEAFRATLSDCLTQIAANAATLRLARSVEGLHQLRVAFRRLEVALGAFGREFGQDWIEELRGRANFSGAPVAGPRSGCLHQQALGNLAQVRHQRRPAPIALPRRSRA